MDPSLRWGDTGWRVLQGIKIGFVLAVLHFRAMRIGFVLSNLKINSRERRAPDLQSGEGKNGNWVRFVVS